jgi:hypothetical protein
MVGEEPSEDSYNQAFIEYERMAAICHPGFSASGVRSSIAHRYYIPEHRSAVRRIFITHFAMLEIRRQNANLKTSKNNGGMTGSSVRAEGEGRSFPGSWTQTTAVLFLGHQPGSQRRFGTASPFDPPFGRRRASLPYAAGATTSRIQTRAAESTGRDVALYD